MIRPKNNIIFFAFFDAKSLTSPSKSIVISVVNIICNAINEFEYVFERPFFTMKFMEFKVK